MTPTAQPVNSPKRRLTPIECHSMLSDQRSVAIVDPAGSVVWMCLPRLDSSPLFSAIVSDPSRGIWSVEPVGAGACSQRYRGDSLVLETVWQTPAGPMTLTDYMDVSGGRAYQRAGRSELVRILEGPGRWRVVFRPRLDFGRVTTRLIVREGGLEIDGWSDPIVLRAPGIEWRIEDEGKHQTALAEVDSGASGVSIELRYGTASFAPATPEEPARRDAVARFWSGWVSSLRIPGIAPDLVKRSALTIKALSHGPSGAIAAAATTSLPEHLGGVRNWDYRYCWIRDACMSASALTRLGNTGTALKLLDWLLQVVEHTDTPERLRPLYTVGGGHLLPEAEIGDLQGYGGSRPVRIGNAASQQIQLDVFGPVVELVSLVADCGAPVTPDHWRLVEAMVNAVITRWEEPDHGIWELRMEKRHHVHTKAMCWFAVDRAIQVADKAMGFKRPHWLEVRDRIAADVLEKGWNSEVGAFTAAYGVKALDASALFVGLSGMLPVKDPRFAATAHAIEEGLRRGPVVDRYRCDDGLPGREGGWLICMSWLIQSMAMSGRRELAMELFEQMCSLAGPTGLMSEEFEPELGMALGNFPQAYSHLGVINAAVRLAKH